MNNSLKEASFWKIEISLLSILKTLLPMVIVGAPLLFIISNVVGIILGVIIGVNTYVFQHFFDAVTKAITNKSDLVTVFWMVAALGGIKILTLILNSVSNLLFETFLKKMEGYLNERVHEKSGRIDPVSYESPALLDDINKAREGAVNSLRLLFSIITVLTFYLPYFLFMGVYLFSLKPILALSLVLIFIPVVINQIIRGEVFSRLEDQAAPIRREYEYYERCVCDKEYFKETRMLGAFSFFMDLYRSSLVLLGKKVWDSELKVGLIELGLKIITLTGYFGVLYLLFISLINKEISIGAFAAVFAAINEMFFIMEQVISRNIGDLTKNLGTVKNFIRFLRLPERIGRDSDVNTCNGIVLNKVTFRYPGAEHDTLSEVSFEIKNGETIAVVGENGAGKTTLVKLITGIYLPTAGDVRIGDAYTHEVSAASIYRGISAVFQKYQRYKMTLGENISISDEQQLESVSRLEDAAEKADLNPNTEGFPNGYSTMLSREFGGVDLSGGQWQRVAIARGFYRAHDIIILDEPTASIDPLEEARIFKQFSELSKGKTSIIITHRLGSARIADRIVVMDKGQIEAIGSHDELLCSGGKYAEMFKTQAQWYSSSN